MIFVKPREIQSADIRDEQGQEVVVVRCMTERATFEIWLPTNVVEVARKELQYVTEPDEHGPSWSIVQHVLIQKSGQWFMLSRAQAREMCHGILVTLDALETESIASGSP